MVRSYLIIAALLCAGGTLAQAQTAKPVTNEPAPAAEMAPETGANSFTEGQARSRIESYGFTGVVGLVKDENGIWRAKAMKDGMAMDVALDFKGVIVAR